MADTSARIAASDLLVRALDGLAESAAQTAKIAAITEAMHAEVREFVRQDAAFHSASAAKMLEIGQAIDRLAEQTRRAQDREDRREEAIRAERAETRSWIHRAASAAWNMPELRMLIILVLAGWLGVQAKLLQVGGQP